jgi:membrane protease YdiL (CAAX protease family)
MKQMRQFLTTLVVVWMAGCIGAYVYSQQQHIPLSLAAAAVPAFLVEIAFYMVPGFARVRARFDASGSKAFRAGLITASALAPYLIVLPSTGSFRLSTFLGLLAVVLAAAFWYVWTPPGLALDLLFLALMAAVYLSKLFDQAYGHLTPHLSLGILGKLMWIRLGLMAVLSIRRMQETAVGFVPSAREWRIGAVAYLCFLPVGGTLSYLLRLGRFHPQQTVWWKFALLAIGTFLAFLWVVALAEEFFFRAFLQQLLTRALRSDAGGLIVASVLFGTAHLPFRAFPNWRLAIVAGVLGAFCGAAFLKARSVRASMVAHALVVTTWRLLFTS